jgi:WD40 repeat protein
MRMGLNPDQPRRIRVFISSPNDVLPERRIADRAVAKIEGVWQAYVRMTAERWERRFYEAGSTFQAAIGSMAQFDLVIGILWKRMGSPLPPDVFARNDRTSYESGTAFEIETALMLSKRDGKPNVYLFQKTAPVEFSATTVDEEKRQYDLFTSWWQRTTRDPDGHYRRAYQTFSTPEEFEESLTLLLEEYLRAADIIPSGTAWDTETQGSPYPGLLPYTGIFSTVFFGRALAAASALTELREAASRDVPTLFIVGPSGSGKSSLAFAGLIPAIKRGAISSIDFWRILILEPVGDPIAALAQQLYSEPVLPELSHSPQPSAQQFEEILYQSPDAAARSVKWALDRAQEKARSEVGGGRVPSGKLLIYVDQLETILGHSSQRTFSAILRALVKSESGWLIATIRSDRYPDLQLDPDFLELRRGGALFDLPPPGASEIDDIISGPAHAAGLKFEQRDGISLAKVIRGAVSGPDALPLLQMTLAGLFNQRREKLLIFDAYEAAGGLEGAIAAHAEKVFSTVSSGAQASLDTLLQHLVADIDDAGRLTMRTVALSALATDENLNELVSKMIEARLLVNAEGSVRVAHEALLRRWDRAAKSPVMKAEIIRLRRQVSEDLQLWNKTQLNQDLLQPGTVLAAAEAVVRDNPGSLPRDMERYILHSAEVVAAQAFAEARRARKRAYASFAAAVLLAVLAVTAFKLYIDANHDFSLAILAKANQHLVAMQPSRARVLSNSLRSSDALESLMQFIGFGTANEETTRVRTIAKVSGHASGSPIWARVGDVPANAASFDRGGDNFAVGYADGRIEIFDLRRAGQRRLYQGPTGRVWALRFSPDGRILASATSGDVVLWDLSTDTGQTLCAGPQQVNDLAFDPLGRFLAWALQDGTIRVWDFRSSELFSFEQHKEWVQAIEFSSDGEYLATSGETGTVVLRNTRDWNANPPLRTGRPDLVGLTFRPDGKVIATASLHGSVDIWDVDGHASISLPLRSEKRWKVRFSLNGRWLAVASWDGTVTILDGHSYQYRGTIDASDQRVNDIAISGDKLLAVNESGAIRVWDLSTVRSLFDDYKADSREVLVGQYSTDGSKFAAGGKDGRVTIYSVNRLGELGLLCSAQLNNRITSISFSADGKRIASVGMAEPKPDVEIKDGINIFDTENCDRVAGPINADQSVIRAIAYHPAANKLAWSTRGGQIYITNLDGGQVTTKLPEVHSAGIEEIDFNSDGSLLVSAGRDGRVIVWDVESRSIWRVLREGGRALFTVKFAPGKRLIATGGVQDSIDVWDLDRPPGRELIHVLVVVGGSNRLAFNRKGSVLAVGSDARYISMWSVENWKKFFQLDSLVGVRSVYGFHPQRGDLAFDGEVGLIRVLRQQDTSASVPTALTVGMDVFFDRRLPSTAGDRLVKSASFRRECPLRGR